MRENEFEKKVQQTMDTFEWHPSDAVWQKLEEGLKEKKRRRSLFFLLFSVALLIGGGAAYYYINATVTNGAQKTQANAKTPVQSTATDRAGITDVTKPTQPVADEKSPVANSASNDAQNKSRGTKTSESKSGTVRKQITTTKQSSKKSNRLFKKEIQVNVATNSAGGKQPIAGQEEQTAIAENEMKNGRELITQEAEYGIKIKITEADTIQHRETTTVADSIKVDSLINSDTAFVIRNGKVNKRGKASGIRWAVDVSGSVSSVHGKVFSFHQQSDALRDQQFNYAGLPQRRLPSAIKAGVSFSIGLTGEINISDRSSIAISPVYRYASERIRVGAKQNTFGNGLGAVNTVANNTSGSVYESGGNNPYTNKYHSAGLAIQYQWQLNKGQKTAIIWNAGITPLFLLATNALVYDTTSGGIYYHDKNAFRKFNMNVSTGLYFRFGKDKAVQWAIGPQFSFQTLSLMKKGATEPERFQLYSGVAARIYLPKKK